MLKCYFQDNWHADAKLFNEDQTLALSTIVSGTSYCKRTDGLFDGKGLKYLHRRIIVFGGKKIRIRSAQEDVMAGCLCLK